MVHTHSVSERLETDVFSPVFFLAMLCVFFFLNPPLPLVLFTKWAEVK